MPATPECRRQSTTSSPLASTGSRIRSSRRSRPPPWSGGSSAMALLSRLLEEPRARRGRPVGGAAYAGLRLSRRAPPLQLQARADAGGGLRRPARAPAATLACRVGRRPGSALRRARRRGGGAPRLSLRPERRTEKAVDYAILAAEKSQRRWAHTEALAHFDAALKLLAGMPDTEPNRLRRIDAVVKQAEIKFALGRHAEHIQALEGIRELVERIADPPRQAVWYYWTGFLHSLTGARPEVAIEYCRQASAIADGANLEEIHAFAESCLAQAYTVAGRLRRGADRWRAGRADLRGAREHLVDVPDALDHEYDAQRHRRLGAKPRVLPAGPPVRPGRERPPAQGRRAGGAPARLISTEGDAQTGLKCCEEALALSPIPFDAAQVRAAHGHGLIKAGDPAAGVAELTSAVRVVREIRPALPALGVRPVPGRWVPAAEREFGARARRGRGDCRDQSRGGLPPHRRRGGAAARRGARGRGSRRCGPPPGGGDDHRRGGRIKERDGEDAARPGGAAARERRRGAARALLERALAISEELGTVDDTLRARSALAALETARP